MLRFRPSFSFWPRPFLGESSNGFAAWISRRDAESEQKSDKPLARSTTHASATVNDVWVGFVCKECGAPLAVHRSSNGSKADERSTRGWRVTCTGCGVTEYYALGTLMVRITAS
jgi:RNase P subunit RPR2